MARAPRGGMVSTVNPKRLLHASGCHIEQACGECHIEQACGECHIEQGRGE